MIQMLKCADALHDLAWISRFTSVWMRRYKATQGDVGYVMCVECIIYCIGLVVCSRAPATSKTDSNGSTAGKDRTDCFLSKETCL